MNHTQESDLERPQYAFSVVPDDNWLIRVNAPRFSGIISGHLLH